MTIILAELKCMNSCFIYQYNLLIKQREKSTSMPRIVTTTTVRNECDIVESFCRYTLTLSDMLIINDNSSKDNTVEIISHLIDEGLPIVLLQDIPYNPNTQYLINNYLLQIAIEEYAADIVLSIDVDEFLVTYNGENPRAIIESLDPLVENLIPWRTYIRTHDADDNNTFLPNSFTAHRQEEIQQFYKTIISRKMFSQYGCVLSIGAHNIKYPDETKRLPTHIVPRLLYAHYPIRNSYQAMQKTVQAIRAQIYELL